MIQSFKKWTRTKESESGAAALEFAILLPLMILIFLGLYDTTQFFYCKVKMQRVAYDLNNIISRGNVTQPELVAMMMTAGVIAQPFDFTDEGNVIVTSVSQPAPNPNPNSPAINWQESWPGGTAGSRINAASLPGGLVLQNGQTTIFTEVFYNFKPLFPGFAFENSTFQIYARAASFPRQGDMTSLPQN